ncbi:SDR family oxidoreductase [Pseudomaricurvus alkylphenolicus]|uniref:SDR family NAD(P)-dependent oxidoreductase n=1 Tax=Pseudomaricurvus alkylphenolicus TaxID=1306991 RepID=UPI0014237BCC|nr:SDR family oxidoreductase [Pseudomaricurvus alkylphenolicus]NIB40983.1 SDR family oxidoreductase [Pseudomaricurvus alkylphenolicus]
MHTLDNKIAVITGGTSGIGLAVARNFVAAGARVVICGRRDAAKIAQEIGATAKVLDVTQEAQVETLLQEVSAEVGKIDILVNNAGIAEDGDVESFDSDAMKRIIDINLFGPWYLLKHAPCHMNDGGSIINTGSVAGSGITHAGSGAYSASKAGLSYLARTSAIELAPRGIRVNTVCPAVIAGTGMMGEDDGGAEAQFMGALTALGRMGRQDEVVGIYNFLASDASTFITGQDVRVDGGMTAGIGLPIFAALSGESL